MKYLAAHTPTSGYKYYPQYINISLDDGKIHIRIRPPEKVVDSGQSASQMETAMIVMEPEDFKSLVSEALASLAAP